MVGLRDVLVVAPAAYHHHHHHDHQLLPSAAEHPVIPLLSAAPCLADDSHAKPPAGIQFWQPPPASSNPNPNSSTLSYLRRPVPALDAAAAAAAALAGGGASTCQDCGNQAKKDCSHRRCRTCCKSRGFDCSTHVKSTWVPASRRRERQLSSSAAAGANAPPAAGSSASTSAQKKPRLLSSTTTSHTSTSNTTPPRSFDTSSSHQDASFRESLPGHVRAPAVFKCVRVTSIDDGEDEYAYQAMVRIGGHVFKGLLHDQGLDDPDNPANNGNAIPNISELHLGGGGSGPSDVYGTAAGGASGSGGLLGGATTFGNAIN